MNKRKDAPLPATTDKRKAATEGNDRSFDAKKKKVVQLEEPDAPNEESMSRPEDSEIEVIQKGTAKAQEIVKQKEAVLEDVAAKLQNMFQQCMNQFSQVAEGKSNDAALLLHKLHELYEENQQLSDQLKRIQTQTAFLFQCIHGSPSVVADSDSPEF